MRRVSDIGVAAGLCIFILGTCCIDSGGMYGAIASGACVLGGVIAVISYMAERMIERRSRRHISDFRQMDKLDANMEFIEEGGTSEE